MPTADKWDATQCKQGRFKDYTGVDSLAAPVLSFVLFVVIHYAEKMKGSPLFSLPAKYMTPYTKSPEGDIVPVDVTVKL